MRTAVTVEEQANHCSGPVWYPRRCINLMNRPDNFQLISKTGLEPLSALSVTKWSGSFESRVQVPEHRYFSLYRFMQGSIHREDERSKPRQAGAISLRPPGSKSVHSSVGKVAFVQLSLSVDIIANLLEDGHDHMLKTLLTVERERFDCELFERIFNQIVNMREELPFKTRALLDAYAVTLAEQIVRIEFYGGSLDDTEPYRLGKVTLKEIEEFIRDRLGEDLSLTTLSSIAGMSNSQFIRAFKRSTGKSPHQAIIDARIDAACQLLRTGNMPMKDIAILVGFSSPSHFSNVFRKRMECSPFAYRQYQTQN